MMDILATPPTNSGARLLYLPLDAIEIPEGGVRRAAVEAAQEDGLRASVAALGVISPIAVRAHPEDAQRRILITGRRRLAAARAAGLATIAVADHGVIPENEALAIETAENLQREPLAPLDQWLAIRRHVALGWSLDAAAEALGLSQRAARRLEKLGGMAPEILAAVEKHGMQGLRDDDLGAIAAATPERQREALRLTMKEFGYDRGRVIEEEDGFPWEVIAEHCAEARLPRARAIFDVATAGVVFEEDLFAEPGSDEEWTTRDIPGFLAAQRAALEARAAASKGRLVVAKLDSYGSSLVGTPKGTPNWQWRWGQKTPPGHTIYAAVARDGRITAVAIRAETAATAAPAQPSPSPHAGEGRGEGAVPGDSRDDGGLDETDDAEDLDDSPVAAPPRIAPPKPRFSEAGRILLAERKTDALRAALRDRPPPSAEALLRVLLLALAGSNVTVRGTPADEVIHHRPFADIAAAAWHLGDAPDAGDRLRRLAAEAAARMLRCGPTAGASGWTNHSGDAAEWVGALLEAERDLPRLDDEALLTKASNDALTAACHAAGLSAKGTGKAMRAALQDRAEGVILFDEARFRAAPPSLEPLAPPDEDDVEEDGATWAARLARLGLSPDDIEQDGETVRIRKQEGTPA